MNTQETFLCSLQTFRTVAVAVDLDDCLSATAMEYADSIRSFRVLVPFVGSFNAGKTSLVNAYLRRDAGQGLPTDIVPQTALATEVHPADAGGERVELVDADDETLRRVDLVDFGRIEKEALGEATESSVCYAKAFLDSELLTLDRRRIVVDMPGLDSGIRNHNSAIQRYLPLGSYFVLIVDIEHGALRESEILQLQEFLDHEVEFAVFVNKSDKKKQDRDAVVDHIQEQVRAAFGKMAPVHTVSAMNSDIGPLESAVESVNFDDALRNLWRRPLVSLFDEAIVSLQTRYSAINVSSAESERAIADLEAQQASLEERLQEDEREIRGRYSRRAVEQILREVKDEIRAHADSLASSYEEGGERTFQDNINELVRATLNRSLGVARTETSREIAERYRVNLDELGARFGKFIADGDDVSAGVSEDARRVGESILNAAKQSSRAFTGAAEGLSSSRGKYLYATIGGVLASVTNVVAPWLEVLLLVLPLLTELFGESREEKQRQARQKLRSAIGARVAPKVASALRSSIADDYDQLAREMLSKLGERIRGQIDRIQEDIRDSQIQIKKGREEAQARKNALAEAMTRLTETKQTLESL